MKCDKCGKEIEEDSEFCKYCGNKINIKKNKEEENKESNNPKDDLKKNHVIINTNTKKVKIKRPISLTALISIFTFFVLILIPFYINPSISRFFYPLWGLFAVFAIVAFILIFFNKQPRKKWFIVSTCVAAILSFVFFIVAIVNTEFDDVNVVKNDETIVETTEITTAEKPSELINNPPIADAGEDIKCDVGDVITLDGSNSRDPDNDKLSYVWSFSGDKYSGETLSLELNEPKKYAINLTVSDGKASDSDIVQIIVKGQEEIVQKIEAVESEEIPEEEAFGEKETEETEEQLAAQQDFNSLTLDEKIGYIIVSLLGNETNNDLPTIVDIEIAPLTGEKGPEGNTAFIILNGNDNLTTNMTKEGMWIDAIKLFKEFFKIEEITRVDLKWQLPLVDKYGNTELGVVMEILLTRDTAERINWDNFLYQNLPEVAEIYQEHPVFSSE
jgi:DNA-directed RNA polymerase subunit RPC12/RpoP